MSAARTRVYTAEATAFGQRTGAVVSSDERLELELSRPAAMGGDGGPGTNPEQLFAAGYAACFHSAMRFGVPRLGLPADALEGSRVTARVHFLRGGQGDFGLAVDLHAHLPRLDADQARALLEETHTVCPYSRATAGNVEVGLHVGDPADDG
ncbi:organic hydroperoxide resistance protein [Geodermatophilus marinus]|uniref:organic hydroperoxide resistance protein n=1 Tax=Geodermatophilus sp. LHW52908 TaxID=2303986 RepID=UPI000E3C669E|nr:organic hydroperoxide resistance protein [Geodermatophilus sp. LHW52908]RFU18879.1 organic hydroperoxide resistance protein [Geodermatophilus sp. LHW52908]